MYEEKAHNMVYDLIKNMKEDGKKGEWDIFITTHHLGGSSLSIVPMEAIAISTKHRGDMEINDKMDKGIYLYARTVDLGDTPVNELITRGYMK